MLTDRQKKAAQVIVNIFLKKVYFFIKKIMEVMHIYYYILVMVY